MNWKQPWLALVLFACGSTAPQRQVVPPSITSEQEHTPTLPEREPLGELTVLENHSESPIVTMRIVFNAGSAEDPVGREGLTRLTATLMTEGGVGELSYREVTEQLYPMAAEMGAQIGRDQTAFVGRVHRDHLEAFYALFRDMLLAPRLTLEDFTRVKNQAINSLTLELRGNDDEELGKEVLQAMLYENHRYGHPALGTETGLQETTLEDVEEQRHRIFCSGRTTIGLSGSYPANFVSRVRDDIGSLHSPSCQGRAAIGSPARVDAPRIWLVDKPEAKAVAVSMGMPIELTRAHPDYPALVLAAAYFGQHRQFAGVLMQKLRGDRGLNYGDYAYIDHFDQEGWSRFPLPNIARREQYFSIWLRPVPPEKAHFAIRMAVRELHRFVESGISPSDFERIRTFADGYYALYLQTESRRLGYALDDAFYGAGQPYVERLHAAWSTLTADQVNAAIRRHIQPARLQIAIVTPDAANLADRISGEEMSPITYPAQVAESILAEDREIEAYRLGFERDGMRIVPLAQTFR